jgi:hypothetical protein
LQKRAPSGFSWPQLGQVSTRKAYDVSVLESSHRQADRSRVIDDRVRLDGACIGPARDPGAKRRVDACRCGNPANKKARNAGLLAST